MTDKEMQRLIMATLAPMMPAGLALARNYQPKQEGAPSIPAIYFVKIGDRRYGHPSRRDVWDVDQGVFVHTERQVYISTYQFQATEPTNQELTASDILNTVSGIIQSDKILSAFLAAGVGVQRVTDVRNPYIVDERDQFEAVPSFDIVLSHWRDTVASVPAAVALEINIGRV